MAVVRFEDLIAWQRARVLAGRIYTCTGRAPFARDFGLAAQVQRAAVSVMANIAEGFERNRSAEFARFLDIARGSLAEVRSHLYIASDIGYVAEDEFADLMVLVDDTAKVLSGLRRSVGAEYRAPGTVDRAPGTSR